MGALYLGEGIDINPRSFMELPKKSVHLEWFLKEGETLIYSFPSYIQKSDDGNSIIIKELRNLTNTILTCAVYSNKDIFLARRNFFFRNIEQANYQKFSLFNEKSSVKRRRKRSLGSDEGFDYDFDKEDSSIDPKDNVKIFQRLFYDYINQHSPSYLKLEHTANSRMQSPYTPPDQFRIDKEIFYGRETRTEPPSVKKGYNDVPPFPKIHYDPKVLSNHQNLFRVRESSLSNEFSQRHSLSFPNDENLALELEEEAKFKKYTFDDSESKLIADCNNKLDCNGNAICRIENDGKNFCKCRSGHYGNGIFCWSLKNLLF
ncbi:uncharacterized protein LOC118202099 [Stegodyphus dumicola]|uniref:uncharacterized protein LOC118202099 n=1 Tax=Stegodyphus dumicola TaxID=202533 RepID=UPI0015AAD5C9|nr:uncharacterized protein LOC118202099 [Stegodyphus dumicola]